MTHQPPPGAANPGAATPPDQFDSRATKQAAPRVPNTNLPQPKLPKVKMPSTPPVARSIPAPNLPRKRNKVAAGTTNGKLAGLIAAGVLGVFVLALGAFGLASIAFGNDVEEAVVRVATPNGNGTGFFIDGPDGHAYVATAFHVVEKGDRILIERIIGSGDDRYTEAYPDTEVVAFDADADIAIIRIKNVDTSRFSTLDLADKPLANEQIRALGYPGSRITRRAGLIAKDGKLLSLVKFPVYDRRERRVVRDNAVDGLLVSAEIEPGFSGGPTINDSDDVVGINVTKDMVHRGQNGVVHVKLLRELLETVKPADEAADPTSKQVEELLAKVDAEFMLLATNDRRNEREHGFIAPSELPRLRELIDEIRRHERDSHIAEGAKLSGRAALGIWASQMPGKALSTYQSGAVQDALTACERSSVRLVSLFSEVGEDDIDEKKAEKEAIKACDDLALRPLAWDLMAATLQWAGEERAFEVTKLERVDDASDIWVAKVRVDDVKNLLSLWITRDYGQLRVKLFDSDGKLYGVKAAHNHANSELAGEWELSKPRAPSHGLTNTEEKTEETITVSLSGRDVTIKHIIRRAYFATSSGGLFRCNSSREIHNGWVQTFSGTVENGVILATPKDEAKRIGRDAKRCRWGYKPDVMASFKLIDGKLAMYRTDGMAYPEVVELNRKRDEPNDEAKSGSLIGE